MRSQRASTDTWHVQNAEKVLAVMRMGPMREILECLLGAGLYFIVLFQTHTNSRRQNLYLSLPIDLRAWAQRLDTPCQGHTTSTK